MENKTRADPGHDLEFFITNSFACLRLKRVESVAEQNKKGEAVSMLKRVNQRRMRVVVLSHFQQRSWLQTNGGGK